MSASNYYKPYSLAEMEVVSQLYPKGDKQTILAALPGRTWPAICRLASSLGVSRQLPANYSRGWSAEHLAILRAHYPGKGAAFVANLIGKPARTVLSYASQHRIRRDLGELRRTLGRPPRPSDWTRAQDALLTKLYPSAPREEVQAAFPGLAWTGICSQANRLKIARLRSIGAIWSEAELQALRSLYGTLPMEALRERLPSRSEQSIRCKAMLLGLKAAPRGRKPAAKRVRKPKAAKLAKPKPAPRVVVPKPLPPVGLNNHSPATPVANAQKALRIAAEKAAQVKPKGHVSADMIRALPAGHPARWAYTKAAVHGPAAAAEAFHQAMQLAA